MSYYDDKNKRNNDQDPYVTVIVILCLTILVISVLMHVVNYYRGVT